MNDQRVMYDRELLLGGAKRDAVLELWEVQRYGSDSFGDADYVSVYGLRPADWYGRGVRLLGRTAVECTRDALADAIGLDVARVAASVPAVARALVVDLFAGSGNTLHCFLVYRENTFTSATIEVAENQKVISTGPYARVRHPMYASAILYLLGTPLALGSYWELVPVVAMMPFLVWRILAEERFLAGNLAEYTDYQKRIHHRLVPFGW